MAGGGAVPVLPSGGVTVIVEEGAWVRFPYWLRLDR